MITPPPDRDRFPAVTRIRTRLASILPTARTRAVVVAADAAAAFAAPAPALTRAAIAIVMSVRRARRCAFTDLAGVGLDRVGGLVASAESRCWLLTRGCGLAAPASGASATARYWISPTAPSVMSRGSSRQQSYPAGLR